MKILNSKWVSFACCCLNVCFAIQCYSTSSWLMLTICSAFAALCGYNFWTQMGEK